MNECLHDQRVWEAFSYACGTASLSLLVVAFRDWVRLLRDVAPRNRGRVLQRTHVGDGTWKLEVSFRDRRGWVVGRAGEWKPHHQPDRECNPILVSWLAREWPLLEKRRLATNAAKYADRLVRPPEPSPVSVDEADELDSFLAEQESEPSSAEQYETDDEDQDDHEQLTIHEVRA